MLLSFRRDEPAGIERSVAALVDGLEMLDHRALVVSARQSDPADCHLQIELPGEATEADLERALSSGGAERLALLLKRLRPDVVCWCDAAWGVGAHADAVWQGPSVLAIHVPRFDPVLSAAIRQADLVLAPSHYVVSALRQGGIVPANVAVLRNALAFNPQQLTSPDRQDLRERGPVRVISRLEPQKGTVEFITGLPRASNRTVEIVLAAASFEYEAGMQTNVYQECVEAAGDRSFVRFLPSLRWADVPRFLGGAAITVVPSIEAETFGLVALESASLGSPVVAFDHGAIGEVLGEAASLVDPAAGASELWTVANELLGDADAYAEMSSAGQRRGEQFDRRDVASDLVALVDLVYERSSGQ